MTGLNPNSNPISPAPSAGLYKVEPADVNAPKVVGDTIYLPTQKYYKLYRLTSPLRPRPTYAMITDDGRVLLITYIPEQQKPRINVIPNPLFWGDVKALTKIVPPWR